MIAHYPHSWLSSRRSPCTTPDAPVFQDASLRIGVPNITQVQPDWRSLLAPHGRTMRGHRRLHVLVSGVKELSTARVSSGGGGGGASCHTRDCMCGRIRAAGEA